MTGVSVSVVFASSGLVIDVFFLVRCVRERAGAANGFGANAGARSRIGTDRFPPGTWGITHTRPM